MIDFFKKLRVEKEQRKEKYWKLKQKDRIEYLLHAKYIKENSDDTSNFIILPYEFCKIFLITVFFMLLTYLAIPSSQELLLKLTLIFIPLFMKIILFGFMIGLLIDILNIYSNNKKKGLFNNNICFNLYCSFYYSPGTINKS